MSGSVVSAPLHWRVGDRCRVGDEVGVVTDAGGQWYSAPGWLTVRMRDGTFVGVHRDKAELPPLPPERVT